MKTDPSFSIWTSLFLLIGILGFIFSLILFLNKEKRKHSWPIALIILGFSLILFQYVMYWTGYLFTNPFLFFHDRSWYLAFGPLFYIYILKFHIKDYRFHFFHLVPALLLFSLTIYYRYVTNYFTNVEPMKTHFLYKLQINLNNPWVAIVSLSIYLSILKDFIGMHHFNKERSINSLQKKWTNILIFLFALFTIAYTSYYVLVNFSFFNNAWDYAISICMSIAIYAVGYMVFKEPQIFNGELLTHIFFPDKDQNKKIEEVTKTEFYNALITYFETTKPYLDNELRLANISDNLGLPTHLLSKIINEKTHKNFNQFINDYRLKEAERLLLSDSADSIKSIYFDVGFNNKTTFNSAFKKKHGCTPTEFRSRL